MARVNSVSDPIPAVARKRSRAGIAFEIGVSTPATAEIPIAAFGATAPRRRPKVVPLAGANSETTTPCSAWQFVGLLHITNFAELRRHLGRQRADRLTQDIVEQIQRRLSGGRVLAIGRTTVELAFEGGDLVDLEAILNCLQAEFAEPLWFDGESHSIDILMGASAAPVGTTEDVRLVEEAESALEQALAERHTVIRDLSAGTPAFDRLTLARELAAAIADGQMFLQYQPKIHVRRQEIASAEALVRWQHPTRGLIMPGDFITMAEEIREIGPLTLWTLRQVISDQRLMAADGSDIPVFINISGQLLADPKFVAEACALVTESNAKIGFEITETSVIRDPQSAIANLQVFADVGITIAIDDYGAGLSSLAYLKQLPARELKIDKLFVLQLTSSHRDPLIVRSTIDLAHALEMEVTAEGVETQAAMALLTVMGCDMVQGYLISRPLSIGAFRKFMNDEKLRPAEEVAYTMFKRPDSFWKSA